MSSDVQEQGTEATREDEGMGGKLKTFTVAFFKFMFGLGATDPRFDFCLTAGSKLENTAATSSVGIEDIERLSLQSAQDRHSAERIGVTCSFFRVLFFTRVVYHVRSLYTDSVCDSHILSTLILLIIIQSVVDFFVMVPVRIVRQFKLQTHAQNRRFPARVWFPMLQSSFLFRCQRWINNFMVMMATAILVLMSLSSQQHLPGECDESTAYRVLATSLMVTALSAVVVMLAIGNSFMAALHGTFDPGSYTVGDGSGILSLLESTTKISYRSLTEDEKASLVARDGETETADPERECAICTSAFVAESNNGGIDQNVAEVDEATEPVRLSNCQHIFHKACIKHWATYVSTSNVGRGCPLCRAPLHAVDSTRDNVAPVSYSVQQTETARRASSGELELSELSVV